MTFMRQVSQTLDTEHRAALDLLGRLEQACARRLARAGGATRSSPRSPAPSRA